MSIPIIKSFIYPELEFGVSLSETSPFLCNNHKDKGKHYMWTYQHNPYLDKLTNYRNSGNYKDSFICDHCVDVAWQKSNRSASVKDKVKELSQYYYCNNCHYNNSIVPFNNRFYCNNCGLDILQYMSYTRKEKLSYILRSLLKFFQESKVYTVYKGLPPSVVSALLFIYVNPNIEEMSDEMLDFNNIKSFNRVNYRKDILTIYHKLMLHGLEMEEETIGKRMLQEVVSGNYE